MPDLIDIARGALYFSGAIAVFGFWYLVTRPGRKTETPDEEFERLWGPAEKPYITNYGLIVPRPPDEITFYSCRHCASALVRMPKRLCPNCRRIMLRN